MVIYIHTHLHTNTHTTNAKSQKQLSRETVTRHGYDLPVTKESWGKLLISLRKYGEKMLIRVVNRKLSLKYFP